MNCKQDDLAYVVKSHNGNQGKVVHCVRLANPEEVARCFYAFASEPCWVISPPLPNTYGGHTPFFPDSRLRPIGNVGKAQTAETQKELSC